MANISPNYYTVEEPLSGIKRPMPKDILDWIPGDFKYAFVCPNGAGYVSYTRPVMTDTGWAVDADAKLKLLSDNFDPSDWENSLIEKEKTTMNTFFNGYAVPKGAFDDDNFKKIVDVFNLATYDECLGHHPLLGENIQMRCGSTDCRKCILRCTAADGDVAESHRRAFADYARRRGYTITRPGYGFLQTLHPGDVVVTEEEAKGRCYWLVVTPGLWYRIERTVVHSYYGVDVKLTQRRKILAGRVPDSSVIAVLRAPDNRGGAFSALQLLEIIEGRRDCDWVVYEKRKEDPVKEMTVDEISKALGYTVKVVGQERKGDD